MAAKFVLPINKKESEPKHESTPAFYGLFLFHELLYVKDEYPGLRDSPYLKL